MAEKVRVAVVGGGRAGTPLIEDFIKRPYVEIVGVADVNPDSPGAALARENGIPYTADALEFCDPNEYVDIIVEVCGDPKVKRALKEAFVDQNNRHTIILHDMVARLMMSIIENSDTLKESVHPEDCGIG